MGTLNKGSFLSLAAAALGLNAGLAFPFTRLDAVAPPMLGYQSIGRRSRTPGKPRPAGAKLARKAANGRVGIAVLH